jgi:hypothetical protein
MNTSNPCAARIVNWALLLRNPCVVRLSDESRTNYATKPKMGVMLSSDRAFSVQMVVVKSTVFARCATSPGEGSMGGIAANKW